MMAHRRVAGVWVKGHTLTAVQANLHFYPLMTYCRSGSDGFNSLAWYLIVREYLGAALLCRKVSTQ